MSLAYKELRFVFALAIFFILMPAALAATGFSAYSKNAEIEVSSCTRYFDIIYVKNNEANPLTFKVTYAGTASEMVEIAPTDFFLLPGEEKEIYSFISPECGKAGLYYLKVFFETNEDLKVLEQKISVIPYYNTVLRENNLSKSFCRNESASFNFILKNAGSFKEHYSVSAINISKKAVLSDGSFYLEPGESKSITLSYSGLKPNEYNSVISVESRISKLEARLPFAFSVSSCLPPKKPFFIKLKDFLLQNIKYLKIALWVLLILLLILFLIWLIKKLYPKIKAWCEKNRDARIKKKEQIRAAKELSKKPYYTQIPKKNLKHVKLIRAAHAVSKVQKKEKAKFPRCLKILFIVLLIAAVLFAVLYFIGFAKVGKFFSGAFSDAAVFFAAMKESKAKENKTINETQKNITSNITATTVPKKTTTTVPKQTTTTVLKITTTTLAKLNASNASKSNATNATVKAKCPCWSFITGLFNKKVPESVNISKQVNASINKTQNASANLTLSKNPVKAVENKTKAAKLPISSENQTAKASAKSFFLAYKNYIILGAAAALIVILFLVFSSRRK